MAAGGGAAGVDAVISTDALLRWLAGDPNIPMRAAVFLADGDVRIGVSAASFFEVSYRVAKGAFSFSMDQFESLLNRKGFAILSASDVHMRRGAVLFHAKSHNDVWDAIIAATADDYDAPVISPDPKFDTLAKHGRIWS